MKIEDKIPELKKRLRKGEPEGELREELKSEGYTKEQIDQVFKPERYDMRSWFLFFFILLLAASFLFSKLFLILDAVVILTWYAEEKKRLKREKLL